MGAIGVAGEFPAGECSKGSGRAKAAVPLRASISIPARNLLRILLRDANVRVAGSGPGVSDERHTVRPPATVTSFCVVPTGDCPKGDHESTRAYLGRAAERRKNEAHGASRGKDSAVMPAPKGGAQENASYIGESARIPDFQQQTTVSVDSAASSDRSVCPPRRNCSRDARGRTSRVNGTADHVHLRIRIPPVHAVADVARVLKTNSSRWVHEKWPHH